MIVLSFAYSNKRIVLALNICLINYFEELNVFDPLA